MKEHIDISAVVPVGKCVDQSGELVREYISVLEQTGLKFELIYVLDGEHAHFLRQLTELSATESRLRIVQLAKTFGEASALTAGFETTQGEIIVTLPAYSQVVVTEIPKLLDELTRCDLAVATRIPVSGSASGFHLLRRRLFHWLVRIATGQTFSDLSCGVRAMKRSVVVELPIYADQYRFFAILATCRGFRVNEVALNETESKQTSGRHSKRDILARFLDLFAIVFLTRFTKRPLRFFGTIGSVLLAVGAVVLGYLVVQRLFFGIALADRPALLLASLMVVLGLQVFALGLLGELIIFTHAKDIKEYTIEKIVN